MLKFQRINTLRLLVESTILQLDILNDILNRN